MARHAGVDLPRNERIEIALTFIAGIGHTGAARSASKAEASLLTPRPTALLSDGETLMRLRE